MVDVDQLLNPVSEEAPCGEDLSYDTGLSELETLIQGKLETQFSAAEEPNWKEVQKAALALAERTKDLRVTLDLTLGLLKLEGWAGFAQGTAILRGLHERYWENFYPRLDPADDNDPTERTNILASLSAPEGTFGDPMRFLERLRAAPLARGARLGPMSLATIGIAADAAKPPAGGGAAAPPPPAGQDRAAVEATFKDSPAEFLTAVRAAVEGAAADVVAISEVWDANVGPGVGPNLEALRAVLKDARNRLNTFAPVAAADEEPMDLDALLSADAATDSGGGDSAPRASGRSRGAAVPGEIASREDVTGALDAICTYYDAQEPSSPVPALLRQARRMVGMNYFQIVTALTPDATPQVRLAEDAAETLTTQTSEAAADPLSAL